MIRRIDIGRKYYPYAPCATIVLNLGTFGAVLPAVGAVLLFYRLLGSEEVTKYVLLLLFAIPCIPLVRAVDQFSDRMSEQESRRNITTKARYARSYCKEHPEEYNSIAAVNPAFAAQYVRDARGGIVKRK